MGEGAGGGPFRVKKHVMSLGSPGILAKARRLQLADASFRDYACIYIYIYIYVCVCVYLYHSISMY